MRGVLRSWGGQCAWGAAFLGRAALLVWAVFGGDVWGRPVDVRMRIPASRALQALRTLRAWFPNNVARNSHVNLLNFKMWSLELQRLWAVLKTDRGELRARFGWGSGFVVVDVIWDSFVVRA